MRLFEDVVRKDAGESRKGCKVVNFAKREESQGGGDHVYIHKHVARRDKVETVKDMDCRDQEKM